MPAEPLVFVEIALTTGIARDLAELLDEDAPDLDPERADTAVFYSISNCQPGLAGVNLGNALIKQVVEQLHRRPSERAALRDAVADPRLPPRGSTTELRTEGDLGPRARAAARRTRSRAAPGSPTTTGRPTRRSSPRCSRSAPAISTTAQDGRVHRSRRQLPLANGASLEADQLARRPEPDRSRPLGRAHGELPLRARSHRRRAPSAYARADGEVAIVERDHESCSPKVRALGSGPWRSSSTSSGTVRRARRTTSARSSSTTSRRGCWRAGRARVCEVRPRRRPTREVPSMVPVPDDELPVRAAVSSGSTPTTPAAPVRGGARRGRYPPGGLPRHRVALPRLRRQRARAGAQLARR